MTYRQTLAALALIGAASTALAHSGVQNPTVAARMEGMSAMGQQMKVIGLMAKGETAFDAEAARAAATAIAARAAETPELFAPEETDPKSEARPAIWQDFEAFTGLATELEAAAWEVSARIDTPQDLRPAMMALGGACKSCHARFRD